MKTVAMVMMMMMVVVVRIVRCRSGMGAKYTYTLSALPISFFIPLTPIPLVVYGESDSNYRYHRPRQKPSYLHCTTPPPTSGGPAPRPLLPGASTMARTCPFVAVGKHGRLAPPEEILANTSKQHLAPASWA
ncbi:hypothetical protein B9Z19DRAFT_650634 [Tuber borchii]|uniref:Secreted protein n=1 Tax=Tuber borchii TaxID=42251 RepID=A0A2T7A8B0_TUBBO|nr:hypothetical protein B9Z19DRAFT_650634 [Tuber borchii]